LLRFRRGEVHLIDKLTPDLYDRLVTEAPGSAVDAGATTDMEFLWFNQGPASPVGRARERVVPLDGLSESGLPSH
jgi:hypothetical protein